MTIEEILKNLSTLPSMTIHEMDIPRYLHLQLTEKFVEQEIEKFNKKADDVDRNWGSYIKEAMIGNYDGFTHNAIPHLIVSNGKDAIYISGWSNMSSETFEKFKTKEKLDSFIQALIEARDEQFN
jgi:hypothetical protein